jgi:hypothetical protein
MKSKNINLYTVTSILSVVVVGAIAFENDIKQWKNPNTTSHR